MSQQALRRTQQLTIIAQDPSVKIAKDPSAKDELSILTAQVFVPAEELAPGPRGYRVQVIDYDSSTGVLYPPLQYRILEDGSYNDPFCGESDKVLLEDPQFHAQNVYAIIMRTLSRFESALGRRVGWGFQGHQLQVAPHAFADANAFYSKEDRALMFGYFPKAVCNSASDDDVSEEDVSEKEPTEIKPCEMVFTCLSHDVIVHETTHALLDGLRGRYTHPSSADQAGFHEGFADIVALLSIFSLSTVVEMIIDKVFLRDRPPEDPRLIHIESLTPEALRDSLLFGLAKEVGQETAKVYEVDKVRKGALRRSVKLTPEEYKADKTGEFNKPHRRGEVLVAAVMNAFLQVWSNRLSTLGSKKVNDKPTQPGELAKPAVGPETSGFLNRNRVVEEGANVADYLLTMIIRALDYSPPTDLEFSDFLSAMLTADREIRPDDSKYQFRKTLRDSFAEYKITPTSKVTGPEPGIWEPPECALRYDRIRLDSMMRDSDEMFRFIWENRRELGLEEEAYTRVISVRPCVRTNPDDGFVLRETVAEYYQYLKLQPFEVKHLGIKTPDNMPAQQEIILYGGAALIFDEFGQLKFNVRNRLLNPKKQTDRLAHLWLSEKRQAFIERDTSQNRFDKMHKMRYGTVPMGFDNKGAWE